MIKSLLRSAACGLAFAAAVAGTLAIAQTITKSVQLSQDPSGPYGVDTVNNLVMTGNRHLLVGGQSPVLTACGTAPTITGTDLAGTVTMGTGTPTGCVITFAQPFASVPHCVAVWPAQILAAQAYTVTATALTLTQTATSSNIFKYVCMSTS